MGPYGFHLWTRSRRGALWRLWREEELQCLAGAAHVRSANGRTFLLAWFDHSACSFDAETGKKLTTFKRNDLWPVRGMQRRAAAPLAGRLFLSMKNGGAQILEVTDEGALREVIQLWSPAVGSWLAVLPDGSRSLVNVQRTRVGYRPTRFIVSIGVSDYGSRDVSACDDRLGSGGKSEGKRKNWEVRGVGSVLLKIVSALSVINSRCKR